MPYMACHQAFSIHKVGYEVGHGRRLYSPRPVQPVARFPHGVGWGGADPLGEGEGGASSFVHRLIITVSPDDIYIVVALIPLFPFPRRGRGALWTDFSPHGPACALEGSLERGSLRGDPRHKSRIHDSSRTRRQYVRNPQWNEVRTMTIFVCVVMRERKR